MDLLISQSPTGASMTQRTAFERVFGSRYVKSTVCRHRAVWRKAPHGLREQFEEMGTDDRACWGEFVRRVEGRSPAKAGGSIGSDQGSVLGDYHDQQTPWSISLPQDGSNRQSAASSWTQQPPNPQPQQQYRGPPAAARGAVRTTQSPPQRHQDQYSSMTPYQFIPPPQQVQNSALHAQQRQSSHYGEQVSSPTAYTTTSPNQPSYPAPYSPVSPISPQGYEHTSPDQYHNAYAAQPPQHQQQPRQPQHQNRYYSQSQGQGAPRSAGPGPQRHFNPNDEGRPLTYQRTPSGYSGRRDDAGVSESEILNMRGASYPGQELTPGRG